MSRTRSGGAVLATILVATIAISAGSAGASTTPDPPHRGMGLVVEPRMASMSTAQVKAEMQAIGVTPASVDLTADAPPAGDQGDVNSCVSWAIDYAAMGWHLRHNDVPGHPLAPMFTYAQIVQGVNEGTYFSDTFEIAEEQGVDTLSDYSDSDDGKYDYTTQPTDDQIANAAHWVISEHEELPVGYDAALTKSSLKEALADETPVVIAIPVYYDFYYIDDMSTYNHTSGSFQGWHAITAFGYDSSGLVIENSWGTSWGDDGFAKLSWTFIQNYIGEAYAVGDVVNEAGPIVSDMEPSAGPAAGAQEVTITGSNFDEDATVMFGDSSGTDVTVNEAGTELTVTTPAHALGAVDVVITTSEGDSAAETYRYAGAPSVSSVSKREGTRKGGTSVKIIGTNLFDAAVTIGGTQRNPTVNSAGTQATFKTPAHAAGSVNISVTTPVGTVAAGKFKYIGAPTIGTVSRRTVSYKGGTQVTVWGTNLKQATVKVGGKSATIVSTAATKVVFKAPKGPKNYSGVFTVNGVGGSKTSGSLIWR